MLACLGFSHTDHHLAVRWLRWVSRLCLEPNGASSEITLVLFGTRRITDAQWDDLRRFHFNSPCMFHVEPAVCLDERETGYPSSATHLFYRALEYCENHHQGQPILWVEPDAVPMRAGWCQAIAVEYASCGTPFMGAVANSGGRHMPGVAVYPANWRALSPCLANALTLTSAWDTACSSQIVAQMAVAKSIHQIWRTQFRGEQLLAMIPATCFLFHQCKTGSLAETLESRLPQP